MVRRWNEKERDMKREAHGTRAHKTVTHQEMNKKKLLCIRKIKNNSQ